MDKKKYKKIEYIEAIEIHLKKQGKKLTNLRKATINELKELTTKYNVDMVDFVSNRKKEKEKEKEEIEEQKLIWKQKDEEIEKIKSHKKWFHNKIIGEGFIPLNVIKNKYILLNQLWDIQHYKANKDKYDKAKIYDNEMTIKLQRKVGGIINGNTINVRGLNVNVISLDTFNPRTTEYIETQYNEEDRLYMLEELKIIDHLYKTINNEEEIKKLLNKALFLCGRNYDDIIRIIDEVKAEDKHYF